MSDDRAVLDRKLSQAQEEQDRQGYLTDPQDEDPFWEAEAAWPE